MKTIFKKNNRGFTLVEIIVVLAILAMLIAVGMPSMQGILSDAKNKTVLMDVAGIKTVLVVDMLTASSVPTWSKLRTILDKGLFDANTKFLFSTNNTNKDSTTVPTEIYGFAYRDATIIDRRGNDIGWVIVTLNQGTKDTLTFDYFPMVGGSGQGTDGTFAPGAIAAKKALIKAVNIAPTGATPLAENVYYVDKGTYVNPGYALP